MTKKRRRGKAALDSTDIAIVRGLRNGRAPFSEVAKGIGSSENTVRARVNRLLADGIFGIVGTVAVNDETLPGHYTAIVGVKARSKDVARVAEEISRLRGVVASTCVSGSFDIIAFALLNTEFSLTHLILEELARVEGITDTETFVVVKDFNFKVPYVL